MEHSEEMNQLLIELQGVLNDFNARIEIDCGNMVIICDGIEGKGMGDEPINYSSLDDVICLS